MFYFPVGREVGGPMVQAVGRQVGGGRQGQGGLQCPPDPGLRHHPHPHSNPTPYLRAVIPRRRELT